MHTIKTCQHGLKLHEAFLSSILSITFSFPLFLFQFLSPLYFCWTFVSLLFWWPVTISIKIWGIMRALLYYCILNGIGSLLWSRNPRLHNFKHSTVGWG
ncbi:hypothetical protein BDV23DRAFT_107812 [Aspergillus alliaceus]|uniref:Uncharacterized protein n=1 Tax=Petromyces alliaceus TaxID=209559 RepID=A0A5N7C3V0_PETAA|nr:hypothetical protein BDV23DRAFT_107812 [Aspergillus alliaceus]